MYWKLINLLGQCCILLLLAIWSNADNGSSKYYYEHWCGGLLQYLDDRYCKKIFPSDYKRDWSCPIEEETTIPQGFQPDVSFEEVKVDTETLKSVITSSEEVNLCLVVTKFVQDVGPVNRYYCLGEESRQMPYETWSSSKIHAVANAAGRLHTNESDCGDSDSNWIYGLDSDTTSTNTAATAASSSSISSTSADNTILPLGDLISIICSYDKTANYTSNALSSYFHDIGWRKRLNDDVLHGWLGAPDDQSLGGNYGEATPDDLSFVLLAYEDEFTRSCAVEKDPNEKIYSNSVSALSSVELLRRLILHREIPEDMRYPGVSWEDVMDILYGAGEQSLAFPGQLWVMSNLKPYIFLFATKNPPDILPNSDCGFSLNSLTKVLPSFVLISPNLPGGLTPVTVKVFL